MTTTDRTPSDDTFDRMGARLDRLQENLLDLKASMDTLHGELTASAVRLQERTERPRYAPATPPPAAPQAPSVNPILLLITGAGLLLWVGCTLHLLGVI